MGVQVSRYPLPVAAPALSAMVPCSHGGGCPLGVDAPAIANALLDGDHPRAYLIARGPNPFASSCGHGCHAPCESACRRRRHGAPVAIAALEAHASGFSTPALLASPEPCTSAHDARSVTGLAGRTVETALLAPRSGRRIAIIGAGVAGLSCAHDLALLGHECVIFDDATEPGGVLTHGLPPFRFPTASVRAECAAILAMHVQYQAGARIDASGLRGLLDSGFDAMFLGVGSSAPVESLVTAVLPSRGVIDAMALLSGRARVDGVPVVVGDGDLAVDAARVALRQLREHGDVATPVHLVLTAELEDATAQPVQIGAALADGVRLHHGWRLERLLTVGEPSALTGLELEHVASSVTTVLACDQVILAGPRVPETPFGDLLALDAQGRIATHPDTLRTSLDRVWAGGACAFGHRSIAHAAADGKRAAWQIHGDLTGHTVAVTLSSAWTEHDDRDMERTARALVAARVDLPLSLAPPLDPFSSTTQRSEGDIRREASRCFDCTALPVINEACTHCGKCVGVCPEHALSLTPTLQLDQDLCTRCGICVDRCPEGAIAMGRVVWEERLGWERLPNR